MKSIQNQTKSFDSNFKNTKCRIMFQHSVLLFLFLFFVTENNVFVNFMNSPTLKRFPSKEYGSMGRLPELSPMTSPKKFDDKNTSISSFQNINFKIMIRYYTRNLYFYLCQIF